MKAKTIKVFLETSKCLFELTLLLVILNTSTHIIECIPDSQTFPNQTCMHTHTHTHTHTSTHLKDTLTQSNGTINVAILGVQLNPSPQFIAQLTITLCLETRQMLNHTIVTLQHSIVTRFSGSHMIFSVMSLYI